MQTYTFLIHWCTVVTNSWLTMSTNFMHGPSSLDICFFTMAWKAMSGVKRPVLKGRKPKKKTGCSAHKMSHQDNVNNVKASDPLHLLRTLYFTWHHEYFWWHSWFPAAASSHQTQAEDKHSTLSAHCYTCTYSIHWPTGQQVLYMHIIQRTSHT